MKKFKTPFTFFVIAEALSLFSQSVFMLVLPWLNLTITQNPAYTSSIATIVTLPAIIVSLTSGHIIDRIGRRRASIIATLGCSIAAAGLAATSTLGIINIVWLITFGLLANVFLIPSMTTRDTLMNNIAIESNIELKKIAGIRQLIFSITFLIGPGIAGVLITHTSSSFLLWMTSGLWLIASIFTSFLPDSMSVANKKKAAESSVWQSIIKSKTILLVMFVALGTCLITAPLTDVLIPAYFHTLNKPELLGLAMMFLAIGTLIGSILYMLLMKAKAARLTYIVSILLMTISMTFLLLLQDFRLPILGLFLMGLASSMATPYFMVAITTHSKESERGRVIAIYNTLSLGVTPVGLGLLAIVLIYEPLQTGFIAALIIWLIVAIAMILGGKKLYNNQYETAITNH